jgi:hypothetical protein
MSGYKGKNLDTAAEIRQIGANPDKWDSVYEGIQSKIRTQIETSAKERDTARIIYEAFGDPNNFTAGCIKILEAVEAHFLERCEKYYRVYLRVPKSYVEDGRVGVTLPWDKFFWVTDQQLCMVYRILHQICHRPPGRLGIQRKRKGIYVGMHWDATLEETERITAELRDRIACWYKYDWNPNAEADAKTDTGADAESQEVEVDDKVETENSEMVE